MPIFFFLSFIDKCNKKITVKLGEIIMNILKLGHTKGNNGIKTEEIKKFLNDSRIVLKKVAASPTVRGEIQKELAEICLEIYDVNESIPGNGNSPINDDTRNRIIKTSERIENLKDVEISCDKESGSAICTIISQSLTIKHHFQTQAISAAG